jgi:hypothetical protein
MAPKRSLLKIAAGGGLVVICDLSMVAVLMKVLPPLKNWSAPKLPVAEPPALIDTLFWVCAKTNVGTVMMSATTQNKVVNLNDRHGDEDFLMDGSSL